MSTDTDFMEPVPESSVPGILWPAIPDPDNALTLAVLGQLLTTQWWSPEMLLRRQLRQLTELVSYSAQTVPFYRGRLAEFARPKRPLSLEQWRSLPILERDDIQDAAASLVTRRPLKGHGTVHDVRTSGTSGDPLIVKRNDVTERFATALALRGYLLHRRDFAGKLADLCGLAGNPEMAASPQRPAGWAPGFPSGPLVSCDLDLPADDILDWLTREDPDYLMVRPGILGALLERSAKRSARPARLRGVLTTGEPLDPELRRTCDDVWEAPVCDVYRTQEAGIIAIQCPEHEEYLVQAEGVFCEVLDGSGAPCNPGEVGRVVVTPLHNFTMPLIRYAVGDYVEVGEPCASGRGLPVLRRIYGRDRSGYPG